MNSLYYHPDTPYIRRAGCIDRATYLGRGLGFLLGTFIAGCTMDAARHFPHGLGLLMVMAGVVLLGLLFVALFVLILIPRVRDTGLPHAWAWSLLFFVHPLSFPFVLALLVIPTNAFARRRCYF